MDCLLADNLRLREGEAGREVLPGVFWESADFVRGLDVEGAELREDWLCESDDDEDEMRGRSGSFSCSWISIETEWEREAIGWSGSGFWTLVQISRITLATSFQDAEGIVW